MVSKPGLALAILAISCIVGASASHEENVSSEQHVEVERPAYDVLFQPKDLSVSVESYEIPSSPTSAYHKKLTKKQLKQYKKSFKALQKGHKIGEKKLRAVNAFKTLKNGQTKAQKKLEKNALKSFKKTEELRKKSLKPFKTAESKAIKAEKKLAKKAMKQLQTLNTGSPVPLAGSTYSFSSYSSSG